jgi:hypothetical protein
MRSARTLILFLVAIVGALALAPPSGAFTVTYGAGVTTSFDVPDNVRLISFEVVGGSGGRDRAAGSTCTPGHGADVTGTATVSAGDTLQVVVGAKGGDAQGAQGGAGGSGAGNGGTVASGAGTAGGGGGGGRSTLLDANTRDAAAAGGGGGCGGFGNSSGGNGGTAGQSGFAGTGDGLGGFAGGGAAGANGGAAGGANLPADANHGGNGAPDQGGNGFGSGSFVAGGGGGGGGGDGGAGGGAASGGDGSGGGGGGGTSFENGSDWNADLTGTAAALGDGHITISYTPQPAPTVTTGASSATDTTANIAGTVNPNGLSTTYHFEYGPSTSYGHATGDGSAAAVFTTGDGSAALVGLAPNTLYHYRLVATSASGTSVGADATFTTTGPPELTPANASGVGNFGASFNAMVSPGGHTTTYHFDYGLSTSYGYQTPEAPVASDQADHLVTAQLAGLEPGTVFHYRLVATNSAGATTGPDQQFQTRAPLIVVTGAPSAVGVAAATVSGTVDPGGRATTYHFAYGTTAAYGHATGDVSAGGGFGSQSVHAALSKLQAGTTYHYRLTATNSAGSQAGLDGVFVTAPARPPAPAPRLSFIGKPTVKGGAVHERLGCSGGRCAVTATLTTIETVRGGRVVAVAASAKRVSVLVGSATLTVPAGAQRSLTVSLNRAGQRLARRFRHLPVKLTVSLATASGKPRVVKTVTLRWP